MKNLGNYEDLEFSEHEKDFVLHAVAGYIKQMDQSNSPIRDKVGAMYEVIDEINDDSFKKTGDKPSCFKGCAHCCHIQVAATEWEAQTVLEYMDYVGMEFEEKDIQKLKDQAAIKTDHDYMVHAQRRCVFLGDDNLCGIYQVRPSACRNYFVFSDPAGCDTFNPTSDRVLTNFNLDTFPPIVALMEKSPVKPFAVHLTNLINQRKTNAIRNSQNVGISDSTECELHSGEQSKEQ